MSDWKRVSKEISFENLHPEMVAALKQHIELYNLGSILSDVLICVQTDSEKIKKGLFGSAEVVYAGVLLTPRWLLWATSGTKTAVMSAQLGDVVIQDYAKTQYAKLVPDSGIEVTGKFTDVAENSSAFIGLDDGAVGGKFKELVLKAAQAAKN